VVRDSADYTPSLGANTQPVRRDYEDYAVGETERHAHAGNKGGGTALVTDETAASGKHSHSAALMFNGIGQPHRLVS
jgi:hypothetical protein